MQVGCIDYTGYEWTASKVQERCGGGADSTYSPSACPTEDLVGSCVSDEGGPDEYIFRFYAPVFDTASAEEACLSGGDGTWVPAP